MSDIFDPVVACASSHPAVDRWNEIVNAIAPRFGVPPNLVKAHLEYESGGNPNVVGGSGRGLGLMQIDYDTRKDFLGRWFYDGPNGKTYKVFDPEVNVLIACRDFIKPAMLAFPENLDAVIAAYNAGIGPVGSAIASGRDLTSVTFRPWYIPAVVSAFSYFNQLSHQVLA